MFSCLALLMNRDANTSKSVWCLVLNVHLPGFCLIRLACVKISLHIDTTSGQTRGPFVCWTELGMDDTRMDLSQFDEAGRSVPTTPLQTTAPSRLSGRLLPPFLNHRWHFPHFRTFFLQLEIWFCFRNLKFWALTNTMVVVCVVHWMIVLVVFCLKLRTRCKVTNRNGEC